MPTKITPCLWFDHEAEDAARFQELENHRYFALRGGGTGCSRKAARFGMTVSFELDGQPFTALNGGPIFKFNEAISLQIDCTTQQGVDDYWEKLTEGGDPDAQQCGWLKDKFGLSWQVVPKILPELFKEPGSPGAERAFWG